MRTIPAHEWDRKPVRIMAKTYEELMKHLDTEDSAVGLLQAHGKLAVRHSCRSESDCLADDLKVEMVGVSSSYPFWNPGEGLNLTLTPIAATPASCGPVTVWCLKSHVMIRGFGEAPVLDEGDVYLKATLDLETGEGGLEYLFRLDVNCGLNTVMELVIKLFLPPTASTQEKRAIAP